MTERIPCKTEGCQATILPTTAAKTGGYCMPCHQEQERQKRQAYIEAHRKTVNQYEGLTDPVDVLKIMHAPRVYDPLIQYAPYPLSMEEVYLSLSTDEAARMLNHAIEQLESGDTDEAETILMSLVCYLNLDIADVLPTLMEHDLYHASILFKDAPADIRDLLIEQAEADDDRRNHLLLILSWIGDCEVVSQFQRWSLTPPQWTEQLFVEPEHYALEAGWELTQAGERRSLIHNHSYAIRAASEKQACTAEADTARFLQESRSACPWCSRKLTLLIDVDTAHPSLRYLGFPFERLQVMTCEHCGAYGTLYMELDQQGKPSWSPFNHLPVLPSPDLSADSDADLSRARLILADVPHSPFYTANWALSQRNSQLGGHPSWVQDAEYPVCPCCQQHMSYIGQLDWEDIEQYGEGLFYMFICIEDRITATVYQQS